MERAQEPAEQPTGAAPDPARDPGADPTDRDADQDSHPGMRRVVEKHTVRRSPGGRLALAGLLLPALLAGGVGFLNGPSAEDALVEEAATALRSDGVKGVRLQADGPFVTAYVPTRVDPLRVDQVVSGVDGVSGVRTEEVYSSKKEARACTGLGAKLDRVTGKQRIPFVGESTRLTAQGRRMVLAAAELVSACGSAKVYVGGHTDSSTYNGSTLTLRRAQTMIALMRQAGTPEERLVPRGYGAQYPVAEGESRAAQQRNQRGSITVVEG